MGNLGYTDTPLIPGTEWHVHDPARPQPPVVTPCTAQDVPCAPPSDAVVLFDGTSLDGWVGSSGKAEWKLESGYMEVVPKSGNIRSRETFGSCQLHVEWAAPSVVKGESQGRGNSGVFLMGLYEIQVLDCFENPTYPDGTTGAIYGQYPPLVNACRQPGQWQTYDIVWDAPVFKNDRLLKPAYLTVLHNGIVVHNHTELQGPTMHKLTASYKPHGPTGPLELQDHGDLVRFRNIWFRAL